MIPSSAVRQNWQSTAQPTWLETQMVARSQVRACAFHLVAGIAAVARFSPVAFRHPDGLHALSVGVGHQVADSAVARNEFLFNAGKSDRESLLRQVAPKILGQSRNLLGSFNSLAVKRFKELASPIRGLAELLHQSSQLRKLKP